MPIDPSSVTHRVRFVAANRIADGRHLSWTFSMFIRIIATRRLAKPLVNPQTLIFYCLGNFLYWLNAPRIERPLSRLSTVGNTIHCQKSLKFSSKYENSKFTFLNLQINLIKNFQHLIFLSVVSNRSDWISS